MRRGGHHLEPQGSRATLPAVRRVFIPLAHPSTGHHAGPMSNTDIHQHKAAIRRELRDRRRAIDAPTRDHCAQQVTSFIGSLPAWPKARVVAAYRATADELDPSLIAADAQRAGKTVVYPRALTGGVMTFHKIHTDSELETGPGGILQPKEHAPVVVPDEIDLVLIPLLGCDRYGRRLGYGGGYYDRFLTRSNAMRVGIGFRLQYVDVLPAEAHDQGLDCFVSEAGVVTFGGTAG